MEHSSRRNVAFSALVDRPIEEVARVLVRNSASAFGDTRERHDRVLVEVDVPLGGGETVVSRTAVVELGPPERDASAARLPLTIAAAVGERWFPSFAGHLEARQAPWGETEIRLDGRYTLPLGGLGRLSGHLGGDDLARASLAAIFQATVARLASALHETAPSWRPAAFPEAVDRD